MRSIYAIGHWRCFYADLAVHCKYGGFSVFRGLWIKVSRKKSILFDNLFMRYLNIRLEYMHVAYRMRLKAWRIQHIVHSYIDLDI